MTPRLPLLDDATADAKAQAVFERSQASWGRVPNLYRTLAHAPDLLEAWIAFAWPLRHECSTDRGLRELVILRTAQIDDAAYEWKQHLPMALDAGVSEAQVDALATWNEAPAEIFTEVERDTLALTEQVAAGGHVSDELWQALRSHFDEREVLELVMTAAFYACVSRVLNTLRVPLEED